MEPRTIHLGGLLSVKTAAKALNIHLATIYRWVETGRLVGITVAHVLFIPVDEVARIQANRLRLNPKGKRDGNER